MNATDTTVFTIDHATAAHTRGTSLVLLSSTQGLTLFVDLERVKPLDAAATLAAIIASAELLRDDLLKAASVDVPAQRAAS